VAVIGDRHAYPLGRIHAYATQNHLSPAQTILPRWSPLLRGSCGLRVGLLVECQETVSALWYVDVDD
jgi:hypothetical protein